MIGSRWPTLVSAASLGLLVAGCSGGSSPTPAPTPTPTNTAPVFTSNAAVNLVENTPLSHPVTTTDANGHTVALAITGGADADFFALAADGRLSWASGTRFLTGQPNYDTFEDADHDSVYQVQITATDALGATTAQSLSVTLTNDREGVTGRRIGTGFTRPVALAALPGSGLVLVAEKGGGIYQLDPATGQRTLAVTVSDLSTDGERGIIAMALGPSPDTAQYLFVMHTDAQADIVVTRYLRSALGTAGPIASYEVVRIQRRQSNAGLGGWIAFLNNDLYVGTPDAGGVDDPLDSAQDPNVLLGKILRLTPNPDAASPVLYIGAPGNPYASGGGSPLVFARGLHNPNGGEFVTVATSALLLADRGSSRADEINSAWGQFNLGWPYFEGTTAVRANPPTDLTSPRVVFPRGTGWKMAQGLVGGIVFRGTTGSLAGRYVFADLGGHIWTDVRCGALATLPSLDCGLERRTADVAPASGQIDRPVDLAREVDDPGIFYIVDDDGDIFEVTAR